MSSLSADKAGYRPIKIKFVRMKPIILFIICYLLVIKDVISQDIKSAYHWENHKINMVNEEPWRASFIPLSDINQVYHKQRSSDYYKSLNGKWSFAYSEDFDSRPLDFFKPNFDVSKWNTIDVPRSWQTLGYGLPIMLNAGFLMEKNPPFIKPRFTEGRETGSYRTNFQIPDSWDGREVFVNFAGVESAFWFWINGEKVGYSEDSRTNSEFNITQYLKKGDNVLAVEVYRLSDGAYLEDQDAWRLSGISRDVFLIAQPKTHIQDFFIQTNLDEKYENAQWKADIKIRNSEEKNISGMNVIAKIMDASGKEIEQTTTRIPEIKTQESVTTSITIDIQKPALWSNEFPNLYYVVFQLMAENGQMIDLAGTHFGFREIEIRDRQVFVNGKSFVFRGVNRVEHDPDYGKYVPDENIVKDIQLMKAHNINCIRTAHCPHDPKMYDLCDQYGIWIIDEANVESHGYGFYGNKIAEDTTWTQAHLERLQAMIERDKNHPSVVMWSHGNEAGISSTFAKMDDFAHELDPTRPTHYHFADSTHIGDVLGGADRKIWEDNSFKGANRYLTLKTLEYIAKYENDTRPFLVNEFAHASGNALGNLPEYVELFEKYPALVGGCIWDWIDQGLNETNVDGKHYVACGYDYSDFTRTHCFDGVIFPDRSINSELIEVKGAYQNVLFELVRTNPIEIEINNYHRFSDLSEFYLRWELLENGTKVEDGIIKDIRTEALDKSNVLPDLSYAFNDQKEYILNLSLCRNEKSIWCDAGYEVATGSFALSEWKANVELKKLTSELTISENQSTLTLKLSNVEIGFDKEDGSLCSYTINNDELLKKELHLNFYRTPTTNDNDYKFREKNYSRKWTQVGLAYLKRSLDDLTWRKDSEGNVIIEVKIKYVSDSVDSGFKNTIVYKIHKDGSVLVNPKIEAYGALPNDLPRIGMQMAMKKGFEKFTWYGNGPYASYIDRKAGVKPGIWSGTVDEQWEDFPQPQENGNKSDVRWFKLNDMSGKGLKFIGEQWMDVSLSHYEQVEVKKAKRIDHLSKEDYTIVNIDYRNAPVHNNSCFGNETGPLKQYQLNPGKYEYSFWIVPIR